MNKSTSLGSENIPKLLLKLSAPAIVALLVNAIYNLVDTFFVGQLNDNGAMGAVSLAFPIFMIIAAIGQTMGVGASACISRFLGAKDMKSAKEVATTATLTSAIIGGILSISSLFFIEGIVATTGATGNLAELTEKYLFYILLGGTFTILNMNLNNIIRAEGAAMYSMIAITLGAVVNIVLDPILIFTFDMGVTGASLATTIAQIVSTIYLFSYYFLGKSSVGLSLKFFKPSISLYKDIISTGLPSFARQALASIALALVNVAVIPFGYAAVATIGIILRVISVGTYVLFGIAQGLQPIVAYNFGAKQFDRVKEALKYSVIFSSAFCIFLTIAFIVFSKQIIGVFSNDPEVLSTGSKTLSIMMIFFVANGFQTVVTTLFQSIGMNQRAFILASSRQGIFFIPTILILPKLIGYYGVPLSLVVADICACVLTVIFFFKLRKEFIGMEEQK